MVLSSLYLRGTAKNKDAVVGEQAGSELPESFTALWNIRLIL